MRRVWVGVALAVAAAVGLSGCGDDSDTADNGAATASTGGASEDGATVILKDIAFKPEAVSVKVGDTVTWKFEDKGIPHNVIADDGSFKSETTDTGTFEHTFDKAGSFSYVCTVHPTTMKGTVEVA